MQPDDTYDDPIDCMAEMHYKLFEKFGKADAEPSVQMIRAWVKICEDSHAVNVDNN